MKFYRMLLDKNKYNDIIFGVGNQNIDIKKYDKKYHLLIPTVYSQAFNDLPWKDDWNKFNGFVDEGMFIAVDKKTQECVGFIVSYFRDGYGYISVVAVIPQYRRQGVAIQLINKVIEFLSHDKKKMIKVDVDIDNLNAIKLYKKVGFVINETKED